ncbi:MAG: hypothetical protein FVQ80_07540 [Planctomycetes bacterium]|nr:hypothetical protein [Planctomycetota bacterium]
MAGLDLKNITQKFGILKDYSSLIVPIIIVLVGIFLFIPGQMISGNLQDEMSKKSISEGASKIKSLSKIVSSKQWEIERAYQAAYRVDAEKISKLSEQSSQRALLSYKIFPEPEDKSQMIFEDYGKSYRRGIEKMLEVINAVERPTKRELEKIEDSSSSIQKMISDALCSKKAESGLIYATVADVSGYEYWDMYEYTGIENSVTDCWYWQLSYWVIEDVIETIATINFGSENVYSSPVKRLLDINFTGKDESGKTKAGSGARSMVGEAYYVTSDKDSLTQSFTKRYTDSEMDVVHFNVIVLVSAKSVLPFMDELCKSKNHKFRGFSGKDKEEVLKHNQITILRSSIEPIDRKDEKHEFHRYGNKDEVVKLNLICEYLFSKSGSDSIKPESIKEYMEKLTAQSSNKDGRSSRGRRSKRKKKSR